MTLTRITSDGITDGTITGTDLTTNIDLVDNQKLRLGTGNDLQIYHDGSNSYLNNSTGILNIRNTDGSLIDILSYGSARIRVNAGELAVVCNLNSSVDLYHNNVKKFETTSTGVALTGNLELGDNERIVLGDAGTSDSHIRWDTSHLQIASAGLARFSCSGLSVVNLSGNETQLTTTENGAVELYHDNSKKFHTYSGGCSVFGNFNLEDNDRIRLGDASDLQIYHNGSNSVVQDSGTGKLLLGGDIVEITNAAINEVCLRTTENGGVELMFNDSKKFQTDTSGAEVFGSRLRLADDVKIALGSGADLQIYHDGSHSYLNNFTGSLQVLDANTEKFRVSGTGTSFKDDIFLANDNDKINIGAGNDLQIYHDGTDNIILSMGASCDLLMYVANGELAVKAVANGAVELYHNNSKKFETTSVGVTVTGTVTDSKGDVRKIPQLSKSSAHTIISSDAGKHSINSSGGWVFNTSTGFSVGDAITLINNSGSNQTIDFSAVSAYNTADGATGSRTLAGRGMATAICTAANTYYISGAGLS